jgi:hypothetical protein
MARWTIDQVETWLRAVCADYNSDEVRDYLKKCANIILDHLKQQLDQLRQAAVNGTSAHSFGASSSSSIHSGKRKYPDLGNSAIFGTTTTKGRNKQLTGLSAPASKNVTTAVVSPAPTATETAGQLLSRLKLSAVDFPPNPAAPDQITGKESEAGHCLADPHIFVDAVRKRSTFEIRRLEAQEVIEKESRRMAIESSEKRRKTEYVPFASSSNANKIFTTVNFKPGLVALSNDSDSRAGGGGLEDELEMLLGAPSVVVTPATVVQTAVVGPSQHRAAEAADPKRPAIVNSVNRSANGAEAKVSEQSVGPATNAVAVSGTAVEEKKKATGKSKPRVKMIIE